MIDMQKLAEHAKNVLGPERWRAIHTVPLDQILMQKLADEHSRQAVPFSLYGAVAHLGSKMFYKRAQYNAVLSGLESLNVLHHARVVDVPQVPYDRHSGADYKIASVVREMSTGEKTAAETAYDAQLLNRALEAKQVEHALEVKHANWRQSIVDAGRQFAGSSVGKGMGTAVGAGAVAAPLALGVGAHLRDTTLRQADERTNNAIRNAALLGTGATLTTMIGKKMIDRAIPDRPNVPMLTQHVAQNVTPMARASY